jgi:hypothetical protein
VEEAEEAVVVRHETRDRMEGVVEAAVIQMD